MNDRKATLAFLGYDRVPVDKEKQIWEINRSDESWSKYRLFIQQL